MADDNEKLLIYFEDEEHIVRRLGAAVLACWDQLSDDAREKLIKHAEKVFDDEESERFGEHFEKFLAAHGKKK